MFFRIWKNGYLVSTITHEGYIARTLEGQYVEKLSGVWVMNYQRGKGFLRSTIRNPRIRRLGTVGLNEVGNNVIVDKVFTCFR